MQILGLLDTLESIILDGFKIPLSRKVVLNEDQLLSIIDKMRLLISGGEGLVKKERKEPEAAVSAEAPITEKGGGPEILEQAYQIAREIREGADKYADEVLANLELSTTRVLRTIKAGRDRLAQTEKKGESSAPTR